MLVSVLVFFLRALCGGDVIIATDMDIGWRLGYLYILLAETLAGVHESVTTRKTLLVQRFCV